MFTGNTEVGTDTNKSAIAIANTANTSHVNNKTKIKNMSLIRLFKMPPAISAIDRPFSFRLTTKVPKSWTAPINMVPITIHNNAGSHPQYAAIHGPIMGAAPAIDVKW